MWAKDVGIFQHPEWYPDLTPDSPVEDFQAHLHHQPWKLPAAVQCDFCDTAHGRARVSHSNGRRGLLWSSDMGDGHGYLLQPRLVP